MDLKKRLYDVIRSINDFPVPGIIFRDITPVLKDISLFNDVIDCFASQFKDKGIDKITAIESRGFLFAAPLAIKMSKPFIPIRKKGKLPSEKIEAAYALEYGAAMIEMHKDALCAGDRVLIIDDLLATGGTVNAAVELIEKLNALPVVAAFLIELTGLSGRDGIKNKNVEIFSVLQY